MVIGELVIKSEIMHLQKKLFPLLIALLSSCSVKEIDQHPPKTPENWSADHANTVKTAAVGDLKEWWKQFHDENLNWLIQQTLEQSPDIRQAAARIDEARGLEKTSFAGLFPNITGIADGGRSRSLFLTPVNSNTHDASFDASYEIDLFGKNREASNGANFNTQAVTKDYDWIKLSMAAEVARNYISMRAAEKQILLAEKNLESEKSTLTLVERQRKAGGSSEFDVERTALQVNQSAARIADYKRQKEIYAFTLVTLTGLTADQIKTHLTPAQDIPGIDLTAIADTPASVIANRPDIAAANLRFSQATSLKKSQAAAIFPTISISSMYGISKTAIVDSSTVWSLGGNAAVNLLDFGRIEGQIDAASAREGEAYETWRKAILQGIQDVESALTNVFRIQEQRISLKRAKTNAGKAVMLAQVRYKAGDESLLDVLDAQRQLIDADSALIDAENSYVTSVIALYKALGQY